MRQLNRPALWSGRFTTAATEAAEPLVMAGGLSAFVTFKDTIGKSSGLVAKRRKGTSMPSVPNILPSAYALLFHNSPWPTGVKLTILVAGIFMLRLDATR